MISPRRDKINEHLLDDGSGVNIHTHTQTANRLSEEEPWYPIGLCLCFSVIQKDIFPTLVHKKILMGFIKSFEISCS